jgi:transposase
MVLDIDQVEAIREYWLKGYLPSQIARKVGCHWRTVKRCIEMFKKTGGNAWLLNDVILRTKSLSDKLKRRIHLPTRDAVLAAQRMFEGK